MQQIQDIYHPTKERARNWREIGKLQQGLYRDEYEHDACGVGLVANLSGEASHVIVENGMTILKRLMHRGATAGDSTTGDGAGLLLKIPHGFFAKFLKKRLRAPSGENEVPFFGIAMLFGGEGEERKIEETVLAEGCEILGWRDVPANPDAIGGEARRTMPRIRQLFIDSTDERRLYIIRRQIEKSTRKTYVCSCSSRTITYKGLLLATQIEKFYPDLSDPDFVSPFAIVHQRYSTNTFPSWELAHPFRAIAHNGEINTIKGNLAALAAREPCLASPLFGDELQKVLPVVRGAQSDSASLDNVFELLVAAGRDAPHAMMMLIPQAWGAKYHMGRDVRAFCEYHSAVMEPWDGPAAVAFTDGRGAGAALDRNGLRPARWTLTKEGLFVLASETGVLDIPPEKIERRGRLSPGSILWLDLENRRLVEDAELKARYARRRPYRRWIEENHVPATGLFTSVEPSKDRAVREVTAERRRMFGWSKDDVETVLRTMAETGREPACATGDAASIAALARPPRSLFDCFRQNFAQVTNPPIDPVREELAMSIMTYIGNDGNMLAEGPEHARLVKMTRPVLTDGETERIKNIPGFPAATLGLYFDGSLRDALAALADAAKKAAAGGAKILVLSDKAAPGNATKRIPSVWAVAAANKALSETGARPSTGIVAETGEALEVHHFAVLLGFGATAVNPYLALETAAGFCGGDRTRAVGNYIGAVCAGIMKIMSKMGISTLRSYRSARIFETVGLGPEVVREWFGGAASSTGGMGMEDLEELTRIPRDGETEDAAMRSEEERLWTPRRAAELREAVRNGDYGRFRRFTREIDECSRATLRSQLEFASREAPVPPDAVEPVESIIKRFTGAAMSLGSISPEAHETIAIAMNGLGASSNSGEGGEDPARFGTNKNSAVKQIASARFGVTAGYVRSAKELQIKIAQGAKPGEGGRLPARKADALVAALRHSKPGVPLVSPPPHHDIYSIEDLAETIYDLKSVNPEAGISVKLVSQSGVGTVAAGVAKARAGKIVVSGFDGGTGAAPLSSVKHAGLPWETGLAEVRQTLEKNNLRRRVKLQVDGRLCTGRDIVVGTMLGADEFAFGTAMLVALGCVYCTKCNLDRCPAGIATQDKALRARFAGKPEHLQTYFRFLAREVRETLASIGFKSLDAIRGRADLLRAKPGARFDFRDLLACRPAEAPAADAPSDAKQDGAGQDDAGLIAAVKRGETEIKRKIGNADRAVGAALSGWIVSQPRETAGLAATVRFTGSAGQSFGAFLVKGIRFSLHGEANDYVGKSLSGGVIAIAPPENASFRPEENTIAGNTVAYGATSGEIYVNGRAGERFGVRNSGATLVVEGVGDHGCEYMTGGIAVVLGPVGVNFAAGMTGGVAYVFDENSTFDLNCNLDSVDLRQIERDSPDEALLIQTLERHIEETDSPLARRLIEDWPNSRPRFVAVRGREPLPAVTGTLATGPNANCGN